MSRDEKKALAESGDPFEILKVEKRPDQTFGGFQFVLQVALIDGSKRPMGLKEGSVFTRDDQLEQMIEQDVSPENSVVARLKKQGRSYVLVLSEENIAPKEDDAGDGTE